MWLASREQNVGNNCEGKPRQHLWLWLVRKNASVLRCCAGESCSPLITTFHNNSGQRQHGHESRGRAITQFTIVIELETKVHEVYTITEKAHTTWQEVTWPRCWPATSCCRWWCWWCSWRRCWSPSAPSRSTRRSASTRCAELEPR